VGEVDMKGRVGLEHRVCARKDLRKGRRLREPAVRDRVQMCEVEHRSNPPQARRDREDVAGGPQFADAAHDLDAEWHCPVLLLQSLAQFTELLDDRIDRNLALTSEEEAGMEDDDFGAGALRDAGRVVEHPDRHVELLAAFRVPHEAGERGVDREHDPRIACKLAELLGPRVVHPELAFEVDLAGREAAFLEELNRLFGTLSGGHPGRTKVKFAHPVRVTRSAYG